MALRNRGGKWHFRFKLDGREYAETTGLAATKRNVSEAQAQEVEYRRALLEGRRPTRRLVVREFSDAAEEFLTWAETQYREHPNSYRRIATSLASAKVFFGPQPVSMIDVARIEAYKVARVATTKDDDGEEVKGVRPITVRHDLHALSRFFKFAIKQHWTRENPIRETAIPSDAEAVRMHVLTDEEERRYFALAAKRKDLHDVTRLILNQGLRPDEVVSLRKDDVDLERAQLHVRKGKSPAARRTLDLTSGSLSILAPRMSGISPWVFPSKRKPSEHIKRLNGAHERVCKEAEKAGAAITWVLYDLRHSFATRMAQAGIDLATLAAILGHNSLRILQRYVHPTAEHKKAAMQRYDAVLVAATKEGRPN